MKERIVWMLLLSGFESSESYPSLPSTSPTPLHFQGDFPDNSPVLIHTLSEEFHCRVMCLARDYNDPAWFRTQTSWSKSSALPIWQWIFHKKRVGRLSVIETVNGTYSAKDETHPQCKSHFSYSLHKVTTKNLISGGTNIPVLFQNWPLQVSFLYLFWMFPNPFLVLEVSIVWSTQ